MAPSRQSPQQDDGIAEESIDYSEYEERANTTNGTHDSSGVTSPDGASIASFTEDESAQIDAVEDAMRKLKAAHGSQDWQPALKHKHGVAVMVQKGTVSVNGKEKKLPLFRGRKVIEGYSPEAVFMVTGTRKYWDDWYVSGNLVANLNDSTSLTYMTMKPLPTSRPRDVCLVEKVEATSDGTVYFVATSVTSHRVPPVRDHVRASIPLYGWVLRPTTQNGRPSTDTSYYLQVDPAGSLPLAVSTKVIARRPVQIWKIEEYLQKTGAPAVARASEPAQNGRQQANGQGAAAGAGAMAANGTGTPSKRANRKSVVAGQDASTSGAPATEAGLPPTVKFDDSHATAKDIRAASQRFDELAQDRSWDRAEDGKGSYIYMKRTGKGLPIVKGEASIEGSVTAEQVMATVASPIARQAWDELYVSSELQESANGFDQAVYRESTKGIHPHLEQQTYLLSKGVLRTDPNDENSEVTLLAKSQSGSTGEVELYGWRATPSSSSSIDLVHISQYAAKHDGAALPDFVERIHVAGQASGPRRVKEFIGQYGHAPYFSRWGPGSAQYGGEVDGDLREGRVSWRISAGGKSAPAANGAKEERQVAWLQWSPKMYPQGLALASEIDSALKLAKIEGNDYALQIVFESAIPQGGLVLKASRHSGSDAGEVTYNGQSVSETVAAPRGIGAVQAKRPVERTAAVPQVNGDAAIVSSQPAGTTQTRAVQPSATSQAASPLSESAKASLQNVPKAAADLATIHHPEILRDGRRAVPEDAMLILTKDLYFTRAQMGVISALMALVWAITRFG